MGPGLGEAEPTHSEPLRGSARAAFAGLSAPADVGALVATARRGPALRTALGRWNLISLGLGGIIGAGIFVTTGQAAATIAGPAVILSFFLSALLCCFAALCYAELAALIPVAGSAYTYAYASFGRLVGWFVGWCLVLEYLFSASTVAVGWSGYALSLLRDLGIGGAERWASAPFACDDAGWHATGALFNAPAAAIIVALTGLVTLGIRESARFNDAMVVLKCSIVLLFIACGAFYVDPAHWRPFVPPNAGSFGAFGYSGVLRGAGVVFFAYVGFDTVSVAAQEARDPARDLPPSIFASLGISALLYAGVALVLTGLVPYAQLDVPDPIAVGVDAFAGLAWLAPVIKLGALAGLSSVVLSSLIGQPRIFLAMAGDGVLPAAFARVHPRWRTPHVASLAAGAVAALLAALFPIEVLGELVSLGTLCVFVIVCSGVLVLRRLRPDLPRPFRAPWLGLVAPLGVLGSLAEMFALPSSTWARLCGWILLGALLFCSAELRRRSR